MDTFSDTVLKFSKVGVLDLDSKLIKEGKVGLGSEGFEGKDLKGDSRLNWGLEGCALKFVKEGKLVLGSSGLEEKDLREDLDWDSGLSWIVLKLVKVGSFT